MKDEILKIIKDVAKEKSIHPDILERAFRHQFKVIRDVIATSKDKDEYPIVYIRYLGKFIPRLSYIERRNEELKKEDRRNNRRMAELGNKGSDSRN